MLEFEIQRLWEDYLNAEKDRIHDVTMPALEKFIAALLQDKKSNWQAWAQDLAIQISGGTSNVPVRLPFFRRVLLPALMNGMAKSTPGCARTLAEFYPLLLKTQEISLPENLRTPVDFLQEALRQNPSDQLARERLVKRIASSLEYAVHELPDGVLFENHFATLEECATLLESLEEFCLQVKILNQESQYSSLITECELHFRNYREYLRQGWVDGSYEQFLETYL